MNVAVSRAVPVPYLILTALIVLGADLASKAVVHDRLALGERRWLIDGIVGFERTANNGIAFGIGDGSTGVMWIVVTGLVVLLWFAIRPGLAESLAGELALGAAIGGGVANLIDRLVDGEVTDFLVLGPWPRFNMADSALTLGIIVVALLEIKAGKGFSGDGFVP